MLAGERKRDERPVARADYVRRRETERLEQEREVFRVQLGGIHLAVVVRWVGRVVAPAVQEQAVRRAEGADLSAPVVEIPVAVVHEHHRSAGRARDPEMEHRVVHLHRTQRAHGDGRSGDWCRGGRRRSVRVVAGREGQGDGEEQDRRE